MRQLEFLFIAQKYDIRTDRMVPVTSKDVEVLQEIHEAYSKAREVWQQYPHTKLAKQLNIMHENLLERIKRVANQS
jgi:hypothetical protein